MPAVWHTNTHQFPDRRLLGLHAADSARLVVIAPGMYHQVRSMIGVGTLLMAFEFARDDSFPGHLTPSMHRMVTA